MGGVTALGWPAKAGLGRLGPAKSVQVGPIWHFWSFGGANSSLDRPLGRSGA